MDTIRENYDRIAEEYARQLFHELQGKPLDRELLRRLAVKVRSQGELCDMGCGPGQIARCLSEFGAQVFGLDISPKMLEQARKLNPDLRFCEGNMLALELPDGQLAGIAAFYAIVNLPGEVLPIAFKEMARVLQPGGLLLLAFHVGREVIHPEEMWGQRVSMKFFHFESQTIQRLLTEAGFSIEEVFEREPYGTEVEYQSSRAYIFARKPAEQTVPTDPKERICPPLEPH